MESVKFNEGSCLCKSVTFTTYLNSASFTACHCNMCRKWSGASALAVEVKNNISFSGGDFIQVYSSSEWAERGFCKKCGTHLFYRLKDLSYINVPLGILDNSENLKFELQIFIDKKPNHYSFANKTECMTEAEVFAKFAP